MTDMIMGIPTIRPQTHATVREYAENFKRYGHPGTTILVCDDAPMGTSGPLVEGLRGAARDYPGARILYLGAEEKGAYLMGLETAVQGAGALLQQGYGGNRNWLLLASLGRHLVSVDDDIHPYGLLRKGPHDPCRVLEGGYLPLDVPGGCHQAEFDILGAYGSMLGRPVREVFEGWEGEKPCVGSHLRDANTDLALNISLRPLQAASIELVEGGMPEGRLGIVQTFLSGDPDLDSKDLLWSFLAWGDGRVLQGKVPLQFAIDHYRPCILDHDFRLTAAVLGLDNTSGTIPFIPTRLRFEDYLLRLYSLREHVHVGYCAAVQTHRRAMVNRKNIVSDFVIEGLATLMKELINEGLRATGPLAFRFDPKPGLEDGPLRALWASLVEPLKDIRAACGVARRGPFWNLYRFLVGKEALDLENPGPFIAAKRETILASYAGLGEAMALWPRILDHVERHPLRPRVIRARSKAKPCFPGFHDSRSALSAVP